MISIPHMDFPDRARKQLEKYQSDIDAVSTYAERVKQAEKSFKNKNRDENATFRTVRETLSAMCSGARRCMYCEDSCADEVEHIKPKSLYPELVFVWDNYLYACGPCNGPKNNRFAVFTPGTDALVVVTRKKTDPVLPPMHGDPVLINPRFENPMDFLELDLLGTFYFLPNDDADARSALRAEYTIETLRLNRDVMSMARSIAYEDYRERLKGYILSRDRGESPDQLKQLVSSLLRRGHPTVWHEMKRQRDDSDELRGLFAEVPQALNW